MRDISACPWTAASPVVSQENDSRVVGNWVAWGSPTTWELTADVSEYTKVSDQKTEQVFELFFDRFVEIPLSNDAGAYALGFVTTFTKESFQIVLGDNKDFLKIEKEVPGSDKKILIYSVRRPQDM
jgi:hypothetical protein